MLPSDLLIRDGWIRNNFETGHGRCLSGAISRWAIDENCGESDEHVRLHTETSRLAAAPGGMTEWNDTICPDATTAIAVMRQAEINCGLRPVKVEEVELVTV